MMGFRDLLRETFENPYHVTQGQVVPSAKYGPLQIRYEADLPDGALLDIDISRHSIDVSADPYYAWQVDFGVNGSYDLRNSGNATRTLATVMSAIKAFLRWHKGEFGVPPDEFAFLSKSAEPSRERVYTAMIRRFAGGLGYRLKGVDSSGRWGGAQNTVITVVRKA